MITVAWFAVLVPLLLIVLWILRVETDGFRHWREVLVFFAGLLLGLLIAASLVWGISVLFQYYFPQALEAK